MVTENNRRRGCPWSKEDWLPEQSFESWGAYKNALLETGTRLHNRITSRSHAHAEMTVVLARSGHNMRRSLTCWDLIWFGMGSVIGAGVFVLTGLQARDTTGPAVVLSFAVSGLSAMLSVICYAEFAVEIPVAGGSFAYLRVELGDFVAFIAAGNILLDYIIGCAALARSWTSYFATLLNHSPDDFRVHVPFLGDDYSHLDPIAAAAVLLTGLVSVLSVKGTSRLNNLATAVHLLAILFIIVAGLANAHVENLSPFAPFGVRGVFSASAVLFFAYTGFDGVATLAEETEDPGRDVPVGLVGSMLAVTAIYCLLALTLCLMQPYYDLDPDAAFSVAFQAVGMGWAKYVVAFGALEGMTTALLASTTSQARYVTHIARTHMVPPFLAYVNGSTGTPVNATVVMLVGTATVAFFAELKVLSALLSVSTLFIFLLVSAALLVRRYYVTGETPEGDRNKFVVFLVLIVASSAATAAYWAAASERGWVGYMVTVPAWFLSTAGLWLLVPKARRPKAWGVPMVPWLPSASIMINAFLLGSIDRLSFVRFGVWTLVLLVYYLFWGLHSSYDTARASDDVDDDRAPLQEGEGTSLSC